MDKKSDLLACLARLQFSGKDGVYALELKAGLGISVIADELGYVIMPLIDMPKLLAPTGRTLDDIAEGPADKFNWKTHVITSNDFNLEKFIENLSVVKNYLKGVAEFYA